MPLYMHVITLVIATCAAWLGLLSAAYSADVYPYISGDYRIAVIEGEIEKGDYEKFIELIWENQGEINGVALFSPGGDFREAMKLGRAFRELQLTSSVPSKEADGLPSCEWSSSPPRDPENCTCASACFFAHVGGVHRSGTYLAVHRPYFDPSAYAELPRDEAQSAFDRLQEEAKAYMDEMDVPTKVQEDILDTPADKILVLDEQTVRTHFLFEIPYLYEWLDGRCHQLSTEKESVLGSLRDRLISGKITDIERVFLEELEQREEEESSCRIKERRDARLEAFRAFFATDPSDHAVHEFGAWIAALALMGKPFDELTSIGFVEGETWSGTTTMTRSAQSKEPLVIVSDGHSTTLRTVSTVSVLSHPQPSEEFVLKVLGAMRSAIGPEMSASTDGPVVWEVDGFSITLEMRGPFADGYTLFLKMEPSSD